MKDKRNNIAYKSAYKHFNWNYNIKSPVNYNREIFWLSYVYIYCI
jgi:hypothetical protein